MLGGSVYNKAAAMKWKCSYVSLIGSVDHTSACNRKLEEDTTWSTNEDFLEFDKFFLADEEFSI